MKNYKKLIIIRIILCGLTLIAAAVLFFCLDSGLLPLTSTASTGEMLDFQIGLLMGIGVIILFTIIRYLIALKDETQLKRLYNQEHDERKQLIRQKSGMPAVLIFSILILTASVIAGYYNETVFYTLLAVGMSQLTAGVALKLYYSKKL